MSYFKEIFYGGLSLIEGMAVTVRRLFHPLVTVQYPRKKIPLSSAYRGHIELKIFEDTGTHKCIVCVNCEKTCPSGVIRVQGVKQKEKGPKTANELRHRFQQMLALRPLRRNLSHPNSAIFQGV